MAAIKVFGNRTIRDITRYTLLGLFLLGTAFATCRYGVPYVNKVGRQLEKKVYSGFTNSP